MKNILYFLLLSTLLLSGRPLYAVHTNTENTCPSFDYSARPSFVSSNSPNYYSFVPGIQHHDAKALFDVNESDNNDFATGKYLLPSVVDFHFVKYFDNEVEFSNNYLLLFRKPITCIYLQQQVFRI